MIYGSMRFTYDAQPRLLRGMVNPLRALGKIASGNLPRGCPPDMAACHIVGRLENGRPRLGI